MSDPQKVLVGKSAIVRETRTTPSYFTAAHRQFVGAIGVVHAIVRTESPDDPLIKVKFPPDDRIVFYRLSDLDVQHTDPNVARRAKLGDRGSM